jgi:D-serine deaminase-like pyridoxal phosphate-dependent protein
MSFKENNWFEIQDLDLQDTPALVIYLDRVKHNLHQLIEGIDDIDRLRPHVKTHKSKEITALMVEAGISKFKCATIAEAEMLGICNCKDALLAYQPVGPKLDRFIELIKKYPNTSYSCLVDNLTSATQISAIAQLNKLTISVYIDLNVGMNRTGVGCDERAVALFEAIAKFPNLKVIGLHAYDGHVDERSLAKRTLLCTEIMDKVTQVNIKLKDMGFSPKLIMGGSPSFSIYAKFGTVECSPGTFVLWDKNYLDTIPELNMLPAALVVGRLISKPDHDKVCLDIGHKSVAAENPLKLRISFLNAPRLEIVGQSEEHLVLRAPEDSSHQIGDAFYGLPMHICPTCALYESASIVEKGKIIAKWNIIARDRTISI